VISITAKVGQKYALDKIAGNTRTGTKSWPPGFYKADSSWVENSVFYQSNSRKRHQKYKTGRGCVHTLITLTYLVLRAGPNVHLRALRVQEQALFAKLGSDSYSSLRRHLQSLNQILIAYRQNRLAIQKQCTATVQLRNNVKQPMKTLLFTCSVFTRHSKRARCSRPSKCSGHRLRQESGA